MGKNGLAKKSPLDICIGGLTLTATGITGVLAKPPAIDDFRSAMKFISYVGGAPNWWKGDLANYADLWGDEYVQLLQEVEADEKSLRNMAYVSANVEFVLRSTNLSWSHHRIVAALTPKDQKRLLKEAAPKEGEQTPRLSVSKLRAIVEELQATEKRQRLLADAGPVTDERIIVGDFREHSHRIPDGSVSLIFTDPPYDEKAEELFDGFADFAVAKLVEGGSCIFYLGHQQLPAAFKAFDGKLKLWWTVCCLHSGGHALMDMLGVRVGWKPVLWFVKKTREFKQNVVTDVMSGGQEKSHHEWQQSEDEAKYWIDKLCPQDGVVCDPFLGGGTTGAAAESLGRKWIGFEIDELQSRVAATRIAQCQA